jgi:hypothetical protein
MPESASMENREQTPTPAPRVDPELLDLDEVLFEELARVRSEEVVSTIKARLRVQQPEKVSGKVSPGLADALFQQNLTALCLSGGGIRSASFCLGMLQALAQRKLLSGFDYLSTVSGGGYIGSWLSAWRSRDKDKSFEAIEKSLANSGPKPEEDEHEKEPREVTNLRDFTSYLTPRRGLMSSDTWAAIATIFRNLVLNWTLFLPLLLLLVWIPKATLLVFGWLQELLGPGRGRVPWGLGSLALLIAAAALYLWSQWFASRQIVLQEPQRGIIQKKQESRFDKSSPTYGTDQVEFVIKGLIPPYLSACLASVILVRIAEPPYSWVVVSFFAVAGALLWGLPFLIARRRFDGLVAARLVSGAAFGVVLILAFALLQHFYLEKYDRFVVVFGISAFFLAHLAGGTLYAGLSSRRRVDMDFVREWTARAAGWFLVSGLVWTVYASIVLLDLQSLLPEGSPGKLLHLAIGSGGLISGIAAALFGRSSSTPAREGQKSGRDGIKWDRVAVAGAVFFSAVVAFELSWAFDWVVQPDSLANLSKCHVLTLVGALVILLGWLFAASWFIDVNKFSLHAYYRNRLIRSYLGSSNNQRRPSAFTGFDERDNPRMHQLPQDRPIHVVNTALNLVHGKNLAWQERKASSFAVSPLAVGNPQVGYRRAEKYGDGISLGTAMGISGAAASPNMGYHSSPPLAFLMTLFNARLGQWLGNPCRPMWNQAGPRLAFLPFVRELLGLTDAERPFVFLSDGGHFENLGIYEMLRRRCRTIVAVDAGADPEFEFADLGNAIRKVRIDFGVEVSFPQPPSPNRKPTRLGLINRPGMPTPSPYCAIGDIQYPEIPDQQGTLIYIKAAIHGDEPEDISSYATASKAFPHESTIDQFFTESQFESYRQLGLHIGVRVFGRQSEHSDAYELAKIATEHLQARPAAAAT